MLFSILCLLIAIAPTFAMDNDTIVAVENPAQLQSDYYIDANIENDGNGSADNPYNKWNSDKIPDNSVVHLANGEYRLNKAKTYVNLTIIGEDSGKTIIGYLDVVGFTSNGLITLKNVTISDFRINLAQNANLSAVNTIFKGSSASNSIIYSTNRDFGGNTVILDNCSFYDNYAQYGGAINLVESKLNITDSLFADNHADYWGGAIACDGVEVYMSNCKFINDYATNEAGGAIFLKDSNLKACNLELINCSSLFGGSIASLYGDLNLINVTATGNRAKYYGGAIYKMYSSFELYNSTFENNSALNGGALFVDNVGDFKINSNYFANNNASTGGAVYSVLSDSYYDIVDKHLNNTFKNNKANFYEDVYQSEFANLTIGNNEYILMRYNSSYDGSLPARYDLRELGLVTSVKNQGNGGNCWAFSALAALESSILKSINVYYDLSEENMKNLASMYSDYGWAMDTNNGGYEKMAIGYLTSWLGPVNESEDTYNAKSLLSPVLASFMHVQNVVFLKRDNYTDNDVIKKAIIDYGAVSTSLYWSSSYLSGKNYYYTGDQGPNHAVVIVGWDDNYDASNFKTKPKGNGAWIMKNSHSSSSGEKGYFYVSYYDTKFVEPGRYVTYAFVLNDTIRYDKNYQYDIPGRTDYFFNESGIVWYKNKFISSDNEYLAAVSTYFEKDTDWDLFIYVNDELKLTQSGFSQSSYKTIDLDTLIPLNVGDIFEVVFKISVDKDAGVPISESISLNTELYCEDISFISYDGINWVDFYDLEWQYPDHLYYSQVACIKAFTVLDKINTEVILNVTNSFNPVEITANILTQYGTPVNSGKVTFNVDGKNIEVNVKNGVAKFNYLFENLDYNIVKATFTGVGYESSSSSIITKAHEVILTADDLSAYYGNIYYSVRLADTNNNPVSNKQIKFYVDNEYYFVETDAKGVAAIRLNLNVGNYKIKIGFNDSSYSPFRLERNIVVKTTIIPAAATKYTFNAKYSSKLLDSQDNPLKNKEVSVIVNGVEHILTTDSNGILYYTIDLNPGNYQIIITNPDTGEVNTQNIKVVARITGNKDLTMYYGAGSSYKVRVYDDNGNIAKNVEVTFTINGKTYSRFTDSNGYASFKITLNPKTYTIVAKYKGYKVSNKVVVKPTLVCSDKSVKKSKIFSYTVKLLNTKGSILKSKYVTVKFKGKTYKAKTNSKGIATFKLSSNSIGRFTLTATYGSAKISKYITVLKK